MVSNKNCCLTCWFTKAERCLTQCWTFIGHPRTTGHSKPSYDVLCMAHFVPPILMSLFSDADMKNISLDSEILRFHYRVPTFFSQNDVCELKTSARTGQFEKNMFASDSEILRFHYRGTYCSCPFLTQVIWSKSQVLSRLLTNLKLVGSGPAPPSDAEVTHARSLN